MADCALSTGSSSVCAPSRRPTRPEALRMPGRRIGGTSAAVCSGAREGTGTRQPPTARQTPSAAAVRASTARSEATAATRSGSAHAHARAHAATAGGTRLDAEDLRRRAGQETVGGLRVGRGGDFHGREGVRGERGARLLERRKGACASKIRAQPHTRRRVHAQGRSGDAGAEWGGEV